jgi:UDP-glucose 4-epimerase
MHFAAFAYVGESITDPANTTAAGADLDNEIEENHNPEMHLIPLVLDVASGPRENMWPYSAPVTTRRHLHPRDIHVSDMAAAHVKALEALRGGVSSGAYNLGNGNEVLDAAGHRGRDRCYRVIPTVMGPRRPGNPAVLVSDASSAYENLVWSPRIADLARMILTAWACYQKQDSPGINAERRQSSSVAF